MSQNVLIIGASSGMAEEVARAYAAKGANLFLVARHQEKLQAIASDLAARGANAVNTFILDANDIHTIMPMLDAAWVKLKTVDVALVAHGTLPDQELAQIDIAYALSEFRTNADSVIACLTGLATKFQPQGRGVIAVIGSVAGDRGRASNYLYGSAKAAIETFASGLRARLFENGVHVLLVKPGFVATPMTAHLKLPAALTSTATNAAADILKAIHKRQDVLYTAWFWAWVMLVIRWLPSFVFKRLKF
jgi:decaprenylphospho-beta-D-erythro-pentofuranosid-2-ulose 2-reductase